MPAALRDHFAQFPTLVEHATWDVVVAYVFIRIEAAKHRAIYGRLVRHHGTDAELTSKLLGKEHMTRQRFRELFRLVYDKPISPELLDQLSSGEAIRDKIAHAKPWTDAEARLGCAEGFRFAQGFDQLTSELASIRPFHDMRGFKGRGQSLSKETTRRVLLGMGIPAKKAETD